MTKLLDTTVGTVLMGCALTVLLVLRAAVPALIRRRAMELTLLDLTLRWLHFAAGVVWIGHNYSSAAQRPRYRPLAPEDLVTGKSERFMAMLNREHGLFRYASIVAWLAGMILLWRKDWLWPALTLDGPLAGIGVGTWIGT